MKRPLKFGRSLGTPVVSIVLQLLRQSLATHDVETKADLHHDLDDLELMQRDARLFTPQSKAGGNHEAFLIPLRRELSPVIRKGKVMSNRASYSGVIHVGNPHPQEFRVVFDTGSAHVILPSTQCISSACLKHRQYDIQASQTGVAINLNGKPVPQGGIGESVTIGFGTAKITGDFVRDEVCLGPVQQFAKNETPMLPGPCITSHIVTATYMSPRPFEQFKFDGIVGLGLQSLALHKNFSLFSLLTESKHLAFPHFGFFLAEGDDGEASEIAIGGHNPRRLLGPLAWVPMAKPELGYWQVQILAVRVDGELLDICRDGSCHGILDSGTSHLGIPSASSSLLDTMLTTAAGDATDCRVVQAPVVVLELQGVNLTLYPENYMRLLPLPADVLANGNITVSPNSSLTDAPAQEADENPGTHEAEEHAEAQADVAEGSLEEQLLCTPKLLPVSWPEPLGPNIFILGEPVLQRYYTVFDWGGQRAGFGLAAHLRAPRMEPKEPSRKNDLPLQDEVILQQVTLSVRIRRASPCEL